MIIKDYYQYAGENGTIVSQVRLPNTDHILIKRLIPDKGMQLIRDGTRYSVLDVPEGKENLYSEVEETPEETP